MCNVPCQLCGDSDECKLDISKHLEYLQVGSHPLQIPSDVFDEMEDDYDALCEEQN